MKRKLLEGFKPRQHFKSSLPPNLEEEEEEENDEEEGEGEGEEEGGEEEEEEEEGEGEGEGGEEEEEEYAVQYIRIQSHSRFLLYQKNSHLLTIIPSHTMKRSVSNLIHSSFSKEYSTYTTQ